MWILNTYLNNINGSHSINNGDSYTEISNIPVLLKMEATPTLITNLVIRGIIICGGIAYAMHVFKRQRHLLLLNLPAYTILLTGLLFNVMIFVDCLKSLETGVSNPFVYQHKLVAEVLIVLVLGSFMVHYIHLCHDIGCFWKSVVVGLATITNMYMIVRCVRVISTSVVFVSKTEVVLYAQSTCQMDISMYAMILVPHYLTILSMVVFTDEEELQKEVDENVVMVKCEPCNIVNQYYLLIVIYMGIVILIIKPVFYIFPHLIEQDKTDEFLIVPPFVANTVVFFAQKWFDYKEKKQTDSDLVSKENNFISV